MCGTCKNNVCDQVNFSRSMIAIPAIGVKVGAGIGLNIESKVSIDRDALLESIYRMLKVKFTTWEKQELNNRNGQKKQFNADDY